MDGRRTAILAAARESDATLSPSHYETSRVCRLRACFQPSPAESYPRRSTPTVRIGMSFNQTLEQPSRLRAYADQLDLPAYCQRT